MEFALEGLQHSTDAAGIGWLEFSSPAVQARLCLQGAQLMHWQPAHAAHPVLWQPDGVVARRGRATRGGIPLCWPWFGAAAGEGAPAHGFARILDWELSGVRPGADGGVELELRLADPGPGALEASTRAAWPHVADAVLRLDIGEQLSISLETRNRGSSSFALAEAFHTYFRVGDITGTRLHGLECTQYEDRLDPSASLALQEGSIAFAGETDRIHLDPPPCLRIEDPVFGREIQLESRGSASTVVWNPWEAKAARLGDLGPGDRAGAGWRGMLCVETANIGPRSVMVEPGETHRMAVTVSTIPSPARRAGEG